MLDPVSLFAFPNKLSSHDWLHAAYLLSGLLMGAGYVAQIRRGWRLPEATRVAQSFSSWLLWTACRAVALAYGICVMHDGPFIFAVGLDLAGRAGVVLTLLRALWLHRRAGACARPGGLARNTERAHSVTTPAQPMAHTTQPLRISAY